MYRHFLNAACGILLPVLFLSGLLPLSAADSLRIAGAPYEVLNTRDSRLRGELLKPVFSPFPSRLVSFERRTGSDHYLHIYDLGSSTLFEITVEADSTAGSREAGKNYDFYSGQIDWRPLLDKQGFQWFTFVCNGTGANRQVYIGSVGQNSYLKLTSGTGEHSGPRWSPDGNSIAYVSSESGAGDIYLLEDIDRVIEQLDLRRVKRRLLTDTPLEELDIAWNPDPGSRLLAYSSLSRFPGREISTFQIQVLDLKRDKDNVYLVTNDPLADYTVPQWDPHHASRLLYVGQLIAGSGEANLYITELAWGEGGRLRNRDLEGYKTEVFKGVRLLGSRAVWLEGGRSILCQAAIEEESHPLYAINIERWLAREENAVVYMSGIHKTFPKVSEFDSRAANLLLITEQAGSSRLFLMQLEGRDVTAREPEYALQNPSEIPWRKMAIVAGVAGAAGATTWLLFNRNEDDVTSRPIGLPPAFPGSTQ